MPTRRIAVSAAILSTLLTLAGFGAAQTESVLYSFTATDAGAYYPSTALAMDGQGNLYGSAALGGAYDNGTIFQLVPPKNPGGSWTQNAIYNFTGGLDGFNVFGRLTIHGNALYGTTEGGGGTCVLGSWGCGVVFQLTKNPLLGWQYQVIYSFAGGTDGASPYAGVVFDTEGNMYGTTNLGGGSSNCSLFQQITGCGTVYELSPPSKIGGTWTETILYAFSNSTDGAYPESVLTFDRAGNLYGTAYNGAYNSGLVFQLSPPSDGSSAWKQSVVCAFKGGNYDTGDPTGDLTIDHSGNLFGTGALGNATSSCPYACGAAYKLAPPAASGGAWKESIIHKFGSGDDGYNLRGGLATDAAGNLYGATGSGGNDPNCGCGVIYKMARPAVAGQPWDETILHNFAGAPDGNSPNGGLLLDMHSNIYGTSSTGGKWILPCAFSGCGVVFEITQ